MNAADGKFIVNIFFLFCVSTLVYIKLLLLWILVLVADYLLEFRFGLLPPVIQYLASALTSNSFLSVSIHLQFLLVNQHLASIISCQLALISNSFLSVSTWLHFLLVCQHFAPIPSCQSTLGSSSFLSACT